MSRETAKAELDLVIKKSRVHLYKPIQIAEILYRDRVFEDIDLSDLETYRGKSKQWRDIVSMHLTGNRSTSSSKFQDDLFTAIPFTTIMELGEENRKSQGAVEAYIYRCFDNKHNQLSAALNYCHNSTPDTFDVNIFIDSFWKEIGLKRSLDKIYEIVVYALFSALVDALELSVTISINQDKLDIVNEFEDFTKSIMCLDFSNPSYMQDAKVYRVGVTNAADRGLDMYSNWGPAIQIKHLSLDEKLAETIVSSVSSDKIIIVCKDAECNIILSLLTQIGWKSRIQSIVTEKHLLEWYEKALRGKYSDIIGGKLLKNLTDEIIIEFPSIEDSENILTERHYENISDQFWE